MIIAGSSVRLTISIGEDITDASSVLIKYTDPLGGSGQWSANVSDALTGSFYYDLTPSITATAGTWTVWGVVAFPDTTTWKTPGRQFTVYAEGTVQK